MNTEVIFPDGSTSTFNEGGSFHDGEGAIVRLQLIVAEQALTIYLDKGLQLTRNGAQLAIKNVIEPLTGKTYKRSRKGKEEALADCIAMRQSIERAAVVWQEDES